MAQNDLTPSVANTAGDNMMKFLNTAGGVVVNVAGKGLGIDHASSLFGGDDNSWDIAPNDSVGLLKKQQEIQEKNFFFTTASSIQSAEHQTRMAVVHEFK